MVERYDRSEGYCRRLGHHVSFSYCRRVEGGLPCWTVRDCWFERFPIQEFLDAHYSSRELQYLGRPPPGKLESILDVVFSLQEASGSDTH